MKHHQGGCHCGAVRFEAEVDSSKGLICNCSICSKRGSILAFVPETKFKLLRGEESLTSYLFNKHSIEHLFCSKCGILPFAKSKMPDGTAMRAINLRSLVGFDETKVQTQMHNGLLS